MPQAELPSESKTFSYVKYDVESQRKQEAFRKQFETLEAMGHGLVNGRARSLFFTYLEVAYMWTGKAIRDEQIGRDNMTVHEPARSTTPE